MLLKIKNLRYIKQFIRKFSNDIFNDYVLVIIIIAKVNSSGGIEFRYFSPWRVSVAREGGLWSFGRVKLAIFYWFGNNVTSLNHPLFHGKISLFYQWKYKIWNLPGEHLTTPVHPLKSTLSPGIFFHTNTHA